MRVAVTGAGGRLGSAFLTRAGDMHDVVPFLHDALDVTDGTGVTAAIGGARPDVVIHAAAMTAVDACELDPVNAYRVNALGTRNVALACRRAGATLVAISTDYVFDGEKGALYHEFDRPHPISVYGASKLAGEREARLAPEHVIVRTSWVFGGGGDFLGGALRKLAAGETISAIADLMGTPTFVGHLADRLVPLVQAGHRGVVHLAGGEPTSWYDLLTETVGRFGMPGQVTPQKAEELARPAPRPRAPALTSLVLPSDGPLAMPPLADGIREVLEGADGRA
ncbi:MAG TPA: dTDP-4-dehydrorhamnose reductase [Longimicrobiales bacterium]